jgi:hypothetical protein
LSRIEGEDGGPIKVEFALALRKIYGAEVPPPGPEPAPEVVDVEVKPVGLEKDMAGVGVSTDHHYQQTLTSTSAKATIAHY